MGKKEHDRRKMRGKKKKEKKKKGKEEKWAKNVNVSVKLSGEATISRRSNRVNL